MLRGYPPLVFSFFILTTSGLPLSNHHHRFKVPGSLPTETISIIDLGGDPTGKNVSDDAFAAAFVTASTIAKGLNLGSVGSGSNERGENGGELLGRQPSSSNLTKSSHPEGQSLLWTFRSYHCAITHKLCCLGRPCLWQYLHVYALLRQLSTTTL